MAHELNDDTLYTSALTSTSRIFGALSADATEPTSFGREAILNYIISGLATVASSGSASDLGTGTLPLGRLHGRLQDIANVGTWAQGDLIYFNGSNLVNLGPGTSGQYLKTQGAGANPVWATVSGGGSGDVATDAIWNAKGDLAVGTGSDTASRLAIGTDGQILVADSSQATGVKWATASGTGDLLAANNLSDVASASTARSNLGLAIGTNVQAYDATLQSLSSLGTTADRLAYTTGTDTWAEATLTTFARSLLDDVDQSAARSTLGLVIGTNVQAYDAELAALAGLTSAADKVPYFTGSGTAALADFSSFGRNLVDDADAAAGRTTLGVVIGTNVQAYNARLADVAGASWAQGDVMYFDGTNLVRLAAGTNGHFLKTQGAGANPTWAAASGSGAVATDTIWDAKGDLAVGTGADAASRLAVGSNGQVLSADSSTATGLKWITVAGTGDVTAASSFSADNRLVRSDGTGKGVQDSGITVDDTANMSGVAALSTTTIELGHATDTTISRVSAGVIAVEGSNVLLASNIGTSVQGYDADLAALAALATTGVIARTGAGTVATRTLTAPAAGITISNGDGVSGNPTLALANDLSALEGLAGTGIAVRTASDTWAQRTITAPAAGITVSNGDGVSGNPTLALANDLAALEALSGTNTMYYRSGADTWSAVTIGGHLSFSGGTLNVGDAELTAIAGLTSAADRVPYFTGSGTAALATFTSFARTLVDDADAATARTTLGIRYIYPEAYGAVGDGSTDDTSALTSMWSAVNGSGNCVVFLDREYVDTTARTITASNVHVIGNGKGGFIANGSSSMYGMLNVGTALSTITARALSSNASRGDVTLNFASVTSMSVGQILMLQWVNSATSSTARFYARIEAISGTAVRLSHPIPWDLSTSITFGTTSGSAISCGTPVENVWIDHVRFRKGNHSNGSSTVTITIAAPGVISYTSHGLSASAAVTLSTTGTLPSPLVAGQTYHVAASPGTNDFSLIETVDGGFGVATINTSGSQSGTHTLTKLNVSLAGLRFHAAYRCGSRDIYTENMRSGGLVVQGCVDCTFDGHMSFGDGMATHDAAICTYGATGCSFARLSITNGGYFGFDPFYFHHSTVHGIKINRLGASHIFCRAIKTWDMSKSQIFGINITESYGVGLFIENQTRDSVFSGGSVSIRKCGRTVSKTVTMTIASPCVVTWVAHGLAANAEVEFDTSGALPTGVTAGTKYYVKNGATDTFEIATTPGGASVNTSGSQSGSHTGYRGYAAQGICTNGQVNADNALIGLSCRGTSTADSGTDFALATGDLRTRLEGCFYDTIYLGGDVARFGVTVAGSGLAQGDILYHNGTDWTRLAAGTSGQVLQTQGTGANPQWATVSGSGDVTAAANFGTDNVLIRADGTGKGVQASGITISDTDAITGAASIAVTASGGVVLGSTKSLYADSNYTYLVDPSGTNRILIGGSGDQIIYHRRNTHRFQNAAASAVLAEIITTGLYLPSGQTIELGHASDTTISRASAGVVAVEGVPLKSAGKETVWIPAAAMTARTTNGAAAGTVETTTNKIMFSTLDFDTTTQEFAQFAIRMPKSWNEGTVTAAFTWSHASTTTNFGVVWALEAVAMSDDDAGDAAFGTAQQVADTGGTTNDIYVTAATSAITIAGTPAAEDWVVFQVKRVPSDGSDTMAIDARLHGVTLYITTDAATDA